MRNCLTTRITHAGAAALAVILLPVAAAAQSAPSPAPGAQGPMIVERVNSGFLFAPDVKVTRFDRRTSELVGGYAGWLADETFFIGGGGYWMANQSHDRELAYGGLVLGLFAHTDRAVGFSVKALLGGGRAALQRSVTVVDFGPDNNVRITGPGGTGPQIVLPSLVAVNVRVRENFVVAEPEANVVFKLSNRVRLTAGAGYRFASAERGVRDDLGGATGSVALQIAGGR